MKSKLLTALLITTTSPAMALPSFSVRDVSVNENTGKAIVPILMHGQRSNLPSIIEIYTVEGLAKNNLDYEFGPLQVQFPASDYGKWKYLVISIVDDNEAERTETFSVRLRPLSNARLYDGSATVQIMDTDTVAPPAPPTLSINDVTVREEAVKAKITVTKTGSANDIDTKFAWQTVPDTATAPADFTASSGEIVINESGGAADIEIPIIDDADDDDNERFRVVIRSISNASISKSSGYVTITDNDVVVPPPPPMQTCWDESEIPETETCPPEPPPPPPQTQTCWNGVVILTTETCPIQPPPPPPEMQTCWDGTQILATLECPPEPPPPTPDPDPGVPPFEQTPMLASQVSRILTTDFDPNTNLRTGIPIPGTMAPDVVGAFRFVCDSGYLAYDDPVLYPGQPGASHLHQIYGNTQGNAAYSTYERLRESGGSGCNQIGNESTIAHNRSLYWQPALLDGKGNVVQPDNITIYYKRRPKTDPLFNPSNPGFLGYPHDEIPPGIRFIFGWNPVTPSAPITGSAYWNCKGATATPGTYADLTNAATWCPADGKNQLGFVISAPSCWDNTNLDSADHRSHIVHPNSSTKKCPPSHPRVLPVFILQSWYSIMPGDDLNLFKLSSDMPGFPRGHSKHADYFGAWDDVAEKIWFAECINKMLDCSAGNLGNGKQLTGAGVPFYPELNKTLWKNPNRLVPIPVDPTP